LILQEHSLTLHETTSDCFLERISAANLAAGKAPPRTIAIAFDEQILEDHSIPMESHDKILNFVVTPTHTYASSKQ
jgi:5-formyltetrahydrofolate cyclo-ligase